MIPFSIQQFGAALLPLCLAFAAFGEDPAHAPSPPPKPSEDKIQVLDDSIQTNGPVRLRKSSWPINIRSCSKPRASSAI